MILSYTSLLQQRLLDPQFREHHRHDQSSSTETLTRPAHTSLATLSWHFRVISLDPQGLNMAQAVRRWPLSVEDRTHS